MRTRIDAQKERLAQEQKVEGMSPEERAEMLEKLESQLEALEHGRLAEAQRQKTNLQQRLAARRAKNARNNKGKKKAAEKKKEEEKQAKEQSLADGLKGMFGRAGTLVLGDHEDDDSELMRRLRAWKVAKKAADEKSLMQTLASATVDLGQDEIKILVLKLMQVEKLLREVRKKKKRQALLADGGMDSARPRSKIQKLGVGSRNATRVGSMRTAGATGAGFGDQSTLRKNSAKADRSHGVDPAARSSYDRTSQY